MDKLYENIKSRRIALGMTQEELAEKMGYTNRSRTCLITCELCNKNVACTAHYSGRKSRHLNKNCRYLRHSAHSAYHSKPHPIAPLAI